MVLDEVASAPGAEIEARFHSECPQVIKNGYVLLDGEKADMALIPVADVPVALRPGKHAILAVQKNAQFKWVPYLGTVVKAAGGRTVMGTVILPVAGEAEAEKIVKTVKKTTDAAGNSALSFEKDGKTYIYRFRMGAEGLVME